MQVGSSKKFLGLSNFMVIRFIFQNLTFNRSKMVLNPPLLKLLNFSLAFVTDFAVISSVVSKAATAQ